MSTEENVDVCDREEVVSENEQTIEEAEVIDAEDAQQEDTGSLEMNQLVEEKNQLQERLLRTQAEFDNYRKRTEKEKLAERKYKSQDFATDLLPVIDNFERALQTEVTEENKGFYEGVQMVYQQLNQALDTHEVQAMEVMGQPFDPNQHHAVMQVEDDTLEANTVVEELQKGFLIKDKVIRPAMVKVNK